MVLILCFAFCLLVSSQAATYNVSLNLEEYLQDPSKIVLGEPFPKGAVHQFQLEVSAHDTHIDGEKVPFGTYFAISTVDYDGSHWENVPVDVTLDCSVNDGLGLWSKLLGRSFHRENTVFIGFGFTDEELKWADLWDIKDNLGEDNSLYLRCSVDISSP